MISLCGGLIAINYFLFNYIFDTRYFEARLYSPLLITSVIFGSLTQYFGGIQISLKRPKENGVTTIFGAAVNLLINLLLMRSMGIYAAAFSTLAANICVCIIRYIKLNDEIKFKISIKTGVYIIYYVYLLVMAYTCNNYIINCFNVLLTCIMFCIINIEFISKLKVKIMRMTS